MDGCGDCGCFIASLYETLARSPIRMRGGYEYAEIPAPELTRILGALRDWTESQCGRRLSPPGAATPTWRKR